MTHALCAQLSLACAVTAILIGKDVLTFKLCACSTKQGELYGDRTAGFHGYSHLTGGFDGGQAEYARVPFGKSRFSFIQQLIWARFRLMLVC